MAPEPTAVDIKDESRLAELGYKQELKRDWGLLHNFGISFSIISVVTGITTLFRYVGPSEYSWTGVLTRNSYGLNTGGPGTTT